MKKKIACLIMCCITIFSLLSGCGIFVLDQEKYLNEVVASVGDVKITKEKLLTLYNNNASSLINNGMTRKEAVEYCLDYLIDNAIVTQSVKKTTPLTAKQKAKAVTDTLDYFKSLTETYEAEVRADWDRESTKSDEKAETKAVYEKYEKKAKLVNVGTEQAPEYSIVKVEANDDEEINQDYVQIFNKFESGEKVDLLSEFKKIWVPEYEDVGEEALKNIAIFYKSQYDSYKKLTNDQILEKTLEKQLERVIDSAYIDSIEDTVADSVIASINTQMVMDEYYRIVNNNKAKYDMVDVGYKKYVEDILSNSSSIYYHPVENEFFYVSNVLLAYSDEQKAEVENLKKMLNRGAITQANYDAKVAKIASQITVNVIDEDGNVTDEKYTAEQILFEMQQAISQGVTAKDKAEIYNKFVYKYNSDPGVQNKDRDYVIGVEKDDDLTRSQMVESFTEASRALYDAGEVGAISGLVLSDYGYHIIQYTGKIGNIITNTNADEVALALDAVYTTLHGNKTFFDEIMETLIQRNDNSEEIKSLYINDYKSNHKLVVYQDRIKELYE